MFQTTDAAFSSMGNGLPFNYNDDNFFGDNALSLPSAEMFATSQKRGENFRDENELPHFRRPCVQHLRNQPESPNPLLSPTPRLDSPDYPNLSSQQSTFPSPSTDYHDMSWAFAEVARYQEKVGQHNLAYEKALGELNQKNISQDQLIGDLLQRDLVLEGLAQRTLARKGELMQAGQEMLAKNKELTQLKQEILTRKEQLQEVTRETLAKRMELDQLTKDSMARREELRLLTQVIPVKNASPVPQGSPSGVESVTTRETVAECSTDASSGIIEPRNSTGIQQNSPMNHASSVEPFRRWLSSSEVIDKTIGQPPKRQRVDVESPLSGASKGQNTCVQDDCMLLPLSPYLIYN